MSPDETFRRGERVQWRYRSGIASGVVRRKLTSRTVVGGRMAAASREDPRYVVVTDSGREVAKRPSALTRSAARG